MRIQLALFVRSFILLQDIGEDLTVKKVSTSLSFVSQLNRIICNGCQRLSPCWHEHHTLCCENSDLVILIVSISSFDLQRSLRHTIVLLQGALDATGACCDGVVDNFGVCNGFDCSGIFQVALAEGSSVNVLTSALGLKASTISTASE